MSRPWCSSPVFALGASALLCIGLFSAAVSILLEEEEEQNRLVAAATEVIPGTLLELRKRQGCSHEDDNMLPVKRKIIFWDRERAESSIQSDYLGPSPRFSMDDFKRMFRMSRVMYNDIRNILCATDPFFRDGFDITGRKKISTDAKLMIAIKVLAYGSCANSFRDYYQLGDSTARLAVKHFTAGIASDHSLQETFLRSMSPSDAKRVESMHYEQHGVRGIAGSLDCSHVPWVNCPVAHHGQFKGKEEVPTVIIEVVSDYQLFAWHAVAGYAGTFNDINVWDNSLLHRSLIDGSFSRNDFEYEIAGTLFSSLYFLVDGIYPPLSRFVRPINVPIGDEECLFTAWQESGRKDVERFFGVLKKKFHLLNGIRTWSLKEVIQTIYCSIIIHNMVVAERVACNAEDVERASFYDVVENDDATLPLDHNTVCHGVNLEQRDVESRLEQLEYLNAVGIHVHDPLLRADAERIRILPQLTRMAERRWGMLYDNSAHKRLTDAIKQHLIMKYRS